MRGRTADELAQAGNVTSRWIRDLCAPGRLADVYKRAEAWFIPYEIGPQWLEGQKKPASPI